MFARRGIVPEACSSWFLPRIVGISQAMEWVATGPRVRRPRRRSTAGSCAACTGRTSCSPPRASWRAEIADNTAPVSVALARTADVDDARRARTRWTPTAPTRAAMFARGQSADAREGVTSFLEKRPAVFPDKVSDGLPDIYPDRVEPAFS